MAGHIIIMVEAAIGQDTMPVITMVTIMAIGVILITDMVMDMVTHTTVVIMVVVTMVVDIMAVADITLTMETPKQHITDQEPTGIQGWHGDCSSRRERGHGGLR